MRIVAIVQARMGSTRLPGKSMLPLIGKPLVQHVIERVQRATKLNTVVLAVPKEPESAQLEAVADATGATFYRFDYLPSEDLVSRYLGAAKASGADLVVRVCADNVVQVPARKWLCCTAVC